MKVICDTTPILSLNSVNLLELLPIIFHTVTVPNAVYRELIAGGKISVPDISLFKWVQLVDNIEEQHHDLFFELDYGERQVLLYALHLQADFVLIDERKARNIAEIFGIRVKGTLGILVEAKRKKYIESFYEKALEMKAKGIHFSTRLIEEIARNLGEI